MVNRGHGIQSSNSIRTRVTVCVWRCRGWIYPIYILRLVTYSPEYVVWIWGCPIWEGDWRYHPSDSSVPTRILADSSTLVRKPGVRPRILSSATWTLAVGPKVQNHHKQERGADLMITNLRRNFGNLQPISNHMQWCSSVLKGNRLHRRDKHLSYEKTRVILTRALIQQAVITY